MLELPITHIRDVATEFHELYRPEELVYAERPGNKPHRYGQAHAFIACVENAQVIGSGSLVVDGKLLVHGLSTGNYAANIQQQLKDYKGLPNGRSLNEEAVLVWGHPNFGHWVCTYLLRLTLLYYKPELRRLPLLIKDDLPRRYLAWLERMGFTNIIPAADGVKVKKLWVPSVVCYRGHYEDMGAYILPESVHLLRTLLIGAQLPAIQRPRIYLSRRNATWRRIENEDAVVHTLRSFNVHAVHMEELSLADQLDLVSRAELIVVQCGGGSPITMLAPTDCRIIELNIPSFAGTFASRCWAHVLGQHFHRIDCKPTAKSGPMPTDWDSVAPVDELAALL